MAGGSDPLQVLILFLSLTTLTAVTALGAVAWLAVKSLVTSQRIRAIHSLASTPTDQPGPAVAGIRSIADLFPPSVPEPDEPSPKIYQSEDGDIRISSRF